MGFDDISARMHRQSGRAGSAPRDFEEYYLLRARILGVLIRDARQTAGLDVNACASLAGVTPDELAAWEVGHAIPSLPQLELLAYALGLPISHFVGQDSELQEQMRRRVDPHEYLALRDRLVGGLLRAAREQRRLTPAQLGAAAGVSAERIAAYELGREAIPAPVLAALAAACDVSLAYFLESSNRIGQFLALQEDLKSFSALPPDVRQFVSVPVNQPYLELAMKLASLSSDELRSIAAAILEITL